MSLCCQEHWNRVVSGLSYPWGQRSMWEGNWEGLCVSMSFHPAPREPLNSCMFPANMTNADEAEEIHVLIPRKKRASIMLFQCNCPIKQKLHTNRSNSRCGWKVLGCWGWDLCRSASKDQCKMCSSLLCWCMPCLLLNPGGFLIFFPMAMQDFQYLLFSTDFLQCTGSHPNTSTSLDNT